MNVINQGDLFWLDLGAPIGSAPGYRRPFVVIQNNALNHGRINSAVKRIRQILDGLKLITEPRDLK
jgi:mRNA-degrading endonuclease toxin of MazEF toxin-antitoxin module